MDSLAAHGNFRTHRRLAFEAQVNAVAVLREPVATPAQMQAIGADTLRNAASSTLCRSPRWIENCGQSYPAWRPVGSL
jgi:hypothetical protein